jgi:hypothetical protein
MILFSHQDVYLNFYFIYLKFSSLKQDPQQRLAANELRKIIDVIFILLNLHMSFDNLLTYFKRGQDHFRLI